MFSSKLTFIKLNCTNIGSNQIFVIKKFVWFIFSICGPFFFVDFSSALIWAEIHTAVLYNVHCEQMHRYTMFVDFKSTHTLSECVYEDSLFQSVALMRMAVVFIPPRVI